MVLRQSQDSNFEFCGFDRSLLNLAQAAWFMMEKHTYIQEQENKEDLFLYLQL